MQELLHADAFTHREGFTHRSVYTRKLLRREPKRLHPRFQTCNFTPLFDVRPSFRARGLQLKFQVASLPKFLTFISCEGLHLKFQKRNFTQVFEIRPLFRAKGRHGHLQNSHVTIYVRASNTHVRASDTHDLRRRFIGATSSSHFTTRCTLVRRTPTISAGDQIRIFTSFHHMFVHSASTIFAENDFKFAFHRTFVRSTFAISAKCHVSMDTAGLPLPP